MMFFDTKAFHHKVMVMSSPCVINSHFEPNLQNEALHYKVMVMSGRHFDDSHSKSHGKQYALHYKVMVMLSSHFVDTPIEMNDIPLEYSFPTRHDYGCSTHDFDEVCIIFMITSPALNFVQSSFPNCIESWLEESFLKRLSLHGKCYIFILVNINSNSLIISIFHEELQFIILMYDVHLFVGLELLRWMHWCYDYP